MALLRDFTAPYSSVESFLYDRVIADAVIAMADAVGDVAPAPSARVLEVGCGGGHLARHMLADRPDLRWTGLDLSADQIRRARTRAQRAEFVVGDALDLPFEDADFDDVLSVASIKHWPDPAQGLAECVRVLRPGGRLLVIEADRGCKLADVRRFVAGWHIPGLLRGVGVALFRTVVAGQSLDLDEARALATPLALQSCSVARIPGTPGLAIQGTKRA